MRLKELRRSRRITQLKLAMDLNLTQNTVRRGACRMPGRSSSAVSAGRAGGKYGRDMGEKTIVNGGYIW